MVDTGHEPERRGYTRQELAQAVGRSRQQLDEYRRRGCPMTNPAEVQEWMRGHVRPRRGGPKTVGQRMAAEGKAGDGEAAAERSIGGGEWLDRFAAGVNWAKDHARRCLADLQQMQPGEERDEAGAWLQAELLLQGLMLLRLGRSCNFPERAGAVQDDPREEPLNVRLLVFLNELEPHAV